MQQNGRAHTHCYTYHGRSSCYLRNMGKSHGAILILRHSRLQTRQTGQNRNDGWRCFCIHTCPYLPQTPNNSPHQCNQSNLYFSMSSFQSLWIERTLSDRTDTAGCTYRPPNSDPNLSGIYPDANLNRVLGNETSQRNLSSLAT